MKIRNTTLTGLALLGALAAAAAIAKDPVLSNEIRVGAYIVMYDAKADDLTGPPLGAIGYVPPGVNVDVNNVTTPYFAYLRRLTPHLVGQLSAGVPPKTETVGKGLASLGSVPFAGQIVSTAKWFSPSLVLNYVFLDESRPLRPYVGVGVNYTRFYDLQSTPAGDAANGGPTAISLSSSVGPVGVLGLRWHIKDHWSAYASYDVARVNSDYVGNTAGVIRRTSIKFNPSTLVLAVGYAF
jgi:outer membrane protein